LNGVPSDSLTAPVCGGDTIELIEAIDGSDAVAVVGDVVSFHPIRCILNNSVISVFAPIFMNGVCVSTDAPLIDRAHINKGDLTVRSVLAQQGISTDNLSERQVLVNIDRTPRVLPQRNYTLKVNAKTVDLDSPVAYGDVIDFSSEVPSFYRIRDVVDIPEGVDSININVNGKDIEMYTRKVQVFMNGHEVKPDEFLIDGADITVYYSKQHQALVSDIFRYIDVDASEALGKRMRLFVDDAPAGFTTNVSEGARVRIVFEERN
jgi:hypothetical protein